MSFELRGNVRLPVDLELARVLCLAIAPAGENRTVARNRGYLDFHAREELALVRHLRELHAFHEHRAIAACGNRNVRFAREAKVLGHLLANRLRAVLGELQQLASIGSPGEFCLVARPALHVTLLFRSGDSRHHVLDGLLHAFVGQEVVQENATLVDEQALEIGVLQELAEHLARALLCATAPHAHATSKVIAAHTGLLLTWVLLASLLLAVIHRGAAKHPAEHVFALHVEPGNTGRKAVTVVGIERDILERIAVATPGAHVVGGPVAVMEVHFGQHVLRKAAHVDLFLQLDVALVVFAGEVAVHNLVCHVPVFIDGGSVRAARFQLGSLDLDHVDGLGIDAVVGFHKTPVQALAQVVNAEVFAVVEHHHLAAALVIHVGAFHEGCHHGIANVVAPETVTVVAQVEALDFLGFGSRGEHGVLEHLVAVVVVVHLDGNALLGLVAAPVTDNGNARVDFPCLGLRGTSVLEEFYVYREFLVAPEVRLLAGFRALGVVVVGNVAASAKIESHAAAHVPLALTTYAAVQVAGRIDACARVEHVVVIHGDGDHRHRDVLVNEVGLRGGVGRLPVHELGAAHHGVLRNLLCRSNLLGTLCGVGSVERAVDLPALRGSRRVDGQIAVETCCREETFLGLVVVLVVLEAHGRG